jgi:hypothetical protein
MRFGPLALDVVARQVSSGQVALHLTPKAFELLALLVREAPRVVPKAELHQELWRETFVSDAALASLVKELRRELRERGRAADLIRTVHGVGYALAAAEPREAIGPGQRGGRRAVWRYAAVMAAAAAATALALRVAWPQRVPPAAVSRLSVAFPASAPHDRRSWHSVAIAPDGARNAYATPRGLAVRPRDRLDVDVLQDLGTSSAHRSSPTMASGSASSTDPSSSGSPCPAAPQRPSPRSATARRPPGERTRSSWRTREASSCWRRKEAIRTS